VGSRQESIPPISEILSDRLSSEQVTTSNQLLTLRIKFEVQPFKTPGAEQEQIPFFRKDHFIDRKKAVEANNDESEAFAL
jgi:hypothetical protein